jgi:hypothetical protein
MHVALNEFIALHITNKMKSETRSSDHYLLGSEYVNWCSEALGLGILLTELSFN